MVGPGTKLFQRILSKNTAAVDIFFLKCESRDQ
jgi:hypothetical protein